MIPAKVHDGDLKEDGGLKAELRKHATRLFATRGFAGTSMRELVEACGCTKPACYYYFSSKEALYRDVVLYHSERMRTLVGATVAGDGSVRERLHEGLDSMIDYSIDTPSAMRLFQRMELASEDTGPVVEGAMCREDHLEVVVELVKLGISTGEVRSDLEPVEAALVIMGAMHFQFEVSVASGEWNRNRIHKTIDLVFDGIGNT